MKKIVILGIIIAIAIISSLYTILTGSNEITVSSKERVIKGEDSYYLVYTNKGTYKVVDNIWYLHFKSSDVYSNLNNQKTYKVKTFGLRIPYLSMYKNIIKAEPLSPDEEIAKHDSGISLSKKWITVYVSHKERVDSTYMVYTDKGPFKVSDNIFFWRWNSSDVYGQIEPNKSYRISVWGTRSGFLSLYKNIIDIEPIN